MVRRPPKFTRPDTPFPYTTLFRSNIAPTQASAVVRAGADGRRELALLRWGFAGPNNAPLINARSETDTAKPTFREAFAARRCLVPAASFYEWQQVDGQKAKQPWRIGLKGGGLFAFAGLWPDACPFDGAAKTGRTARWGREGQ